MATETLNTILTGSGKKPETQTPPAAPTSPDARETIRQATIQAMESKPAPIQPQRISYEEMFKRLNPYQPPTAQELEKERKKQKREQIFAAIGDGISALSNLYFTTQYAPNMYSGKNTASQRTKERWDKLAADRNANMTAYINGLMRARQMDNEYDNNERAWARQLGLDKVKAERDKAADARAEAKEKRDQAMFELNTQLKNNQITESEYKARVAKVEAEYAPQLQQSKINENNASAGASRSRERYYDRGGSGGGSKSKDMQEAYDYWMSLTDEQKKQYRDWNNRYRKVRTGTNEYDRPVYSNQYMDDDDDFIQMVWKQRQGYLNSHDDDFDPEDYKRGGKRSRNSSVPPLN